MKYGNFSLTDRFYSWDIVTYDDSAIFGDFLKSFCSHYAYIAHDMDISETTGELKPLHIHIVCVFKVNKSFNWLKENFPHEQNVLFLPIDKGFFKTRYRYLLHLDDSDKFQYDISSVVHNDIGYFKKYLDDISESDEFLEELLSDDFNIVSFARKYGRDFIKNYNRYLGFRNYVKGIYNND